MKVVNSRIPSLDGLRAISIGLVLIGHLAGTRGFLSRSAVAPFGDFANLGVRVFFVISGFLITSLLLEEARVNGRVSLKLFYLRRTMRIFPAFYVYAAVLALGSLFGWVHLHPGDLLHSATYTVNYQQRPTWLVGHLWSLSLEEQFYLIWPALLAFGGINRAKYIALATIVAAPACRLGFYIFLPDYRWGVGWWFPTIADTMATGCLLAVFRSNLENSARYISALRSKHFLLVPCAAFLANIRGGRLSLGFFETLINLAIGAIIHRVVMFPPRFLNTKSLVHVGIWSYSLYLWQQPFLQRSSAAWVCAFPVNILLALACAACSYMLIERPGLALRKRIERRMRDRQTADLSDQNPATLVRVAHGN